jgi:penicillin-binding protein 1C
VAAACVAIVAALATAGYAITALGPPPLGKELAFSSLVLDRDGKLLRA